MERKSRRRADPLAGQPLVGFDEQPLGVGTRYLDSHQVTTHLVAGGPHPSDVLTAPPRNRVRIGARCSLVVLGVQRLFGAGMLPEVSADASIPQRYLDGIRQLADGIAAYGALCN